MGNAEVYETAIAALYEKTYGRFEHDEEKAIELFDKLLDARIQSHCDTVRSLCLKAGYEKHAAEAIAQIYDIVSLYKAYKSKKASMHWDIEELLAH